MNVRRCFLLLEVVVALALLAGLGVWLLQTQRAALRQYRTAQRLTHVANLTEQLLWTWRENGAPVTLPATGRFDEQLTWRRDVQPVRIATGVLPLQVTLIVTEETPAADAREIYRISWLVPEASAGERK